MEGWAGDEEDFEISVRGFGNRGTGKKRRIYCWNSEGRTYRWKFVTEVVFMLDSGRDNATGEDDVVESKGSSPSAGNSC